MTLTSSPALATSLRLPADLRLTPDQFALVCAENRDTVLSPDASLVLEAS
jgi:virulence-associated protein VagC